MIAVKGALNLLLGLQGRTGTILRPGTALTGEVKYAPSNYSRNLETVSSTVVMGHEFVIGKDSLDAISFPAPKRGDRLVDADLGTMTLSEVRAMYDIGGAIIAYRVRTA